MLLDIMLHSMFYGALTHFPAHSTYFIHHSIFFQCAEETCVFRKLNIVSESGAVDIDAFKQLLNNLTTAQPEWTKAKARVFTKCLTRIPTDYYEDCEINKVLACTFDVLSEVSATIRNTA